MSLTVDSRMYVTWPETILDSETSSKTFLLRYDSGSAGSVQYSSHDFGDFRLLVSYADMQLTRTWRW